MTDSKAWRTDKWLLGTVIYGVIAFAIIGFDYLHREAELGGLASVIVTLPTSLCGIAFLVFTALLSEFVFAHEVTWDLDFLGSIICGFCALVNITLIYFFRLRKAWRKEQKFPLPPSPTEF